MYIKSSLQRTEVIGTVSIRHKWTPVNGGHQKFFAEIDIADVAENVFLNIGLRAGFLATVLFCGLQNRGQDCG